MTKSKTIITAGTRKRAVARATLRPGEGKVRINYQDINSFQPKMARLKLQEPLMLVDEVVSKVNVDIKVVGGGIMAQTDAARVALCRALAEFGGEKVKQTLLSYDRNFFVPDTRRKEACKPNDSKARSKRQSSKR